MPNMNALTSALTLSSISSRTLLGATFAQAVYPSTGSAAFETPVGFARIDITTRDFTQLTPGFAAQAYVNVQTGELVIAFRGSDSAREAFQAGGGAALGKTHLETLN